MSRRPYAVIGYGVVFGEEDLAEDKSMDDFMEDDAIDYFLFPDEDSLLCQQSSGHPEDDMFLFIKESSEFVQTGEYNADLSDVFSIHERTYGEKISGSISTEGYLVLEAKMEKFGLDHLEPKWQLNLSME